MKRTVRHQLPGLLVVIIAACAIFSSCGVKAPPEPPPAPIPDSPTDLSARVREGCVELVWRTPKLHKESVPAASFQVLRAPEPIAGRPPGYQVIHRTTGKSLRDCGLMLDERALYAVRGISGGGKRGKLSKPVRIHNIDPPLRPTGLRSASGDGFIELFWEEPEDMREEASYNIYRAEEAPVFDWEPKNLSPIEETYYADGPLENGVTYIYEVRAVIHEKGYARVEGPGAVKTSVPADTIAPAAPEGVSAVWTNDGVSIHWFKNQESDLAGYIVYRRRSGMGRFTELFYTPITETRYIDKTARPGVEYEYAVRAFDTSSPPNGSAFSDVQFVYSEP